MRLSKSEPGWPQRRHRHAAIGALNSFSSDGFSTSRTSAIGHLVLLRARTAGSEFAPGYAQVDAAAVDAIKEAERRWAEAWNRRDAGFHAPERGAAEVAGSFRWTFLLSSSSQLSTT